MRGREGERGREGAEDKKERMTMGGRGIMKDVEEGEAVNKGSERAEAREVEGAGRW